MRRGRRRRSRFDTNAHAYTNPSAESDAYAYADTHPDTDAFRQFHYLRI
jgi:hypothetical protein